MFGTLRYHADNMNGEFVQQETGVVNGVSSNKPQHLACDNCRVKKIRCSGRRAGCSRCKTLELPCHYPDPAARRNHRKRGLPAGSSDDEPGHAASMPPLSKEASTAVMKPVQLSKMDGGWNKAGLDLMDGTSSTEEPVQAVLDPNAASLSTSEKDAIWHNSFDTFLHADSEFETRIPGAACVPVPAHDSDRRAANSMQRTPNGGYHAKGSAAQGPPASSTPWYLPNTPPSLTTTSTASGTSNPALPRAVDAPDCTCLPIAVFLLDELETRDSINPRVNGLDAILSTHKDVFALCERMIKCDLCLAKSENMMLLNMVFEKLVTLCSVFVNSYFNSLEAGAPSSPACPEPLPLFLGEYELGETDSETVIRALTVKKVSDLEDFLDRMKNVESLSRREAQQWRLSRSERRIGELHHRFLSCMVNNDRVVGLKASNFLDR